MTKLPLQLFYYGSHNGIMQILRRSALPMFAADQLNDPFMPVRDKSLSFSVSDFYGQTVKYICHAILSKSPPQGNPNHPLQKAIVRWRAEERFDDEAEIRETLQGLLPGMVEPVYKDAQAKYQAMLDYVAAKRLLPFFSKVDDLTLWQMEGFSHQGVAIKFSGLSGSLFEACLPVNYTHIPLSAVDAKKYLDYMVGISSNIDSEPEKLLLAQSYQYQKFKEWRLIIEKQKCEDSWLPFPAKLIHGIYLGALFNQDLLEQLVKSLGKFEKPIPIFQAKCKKNEYALQFEQIDQQEILNKLQAEEVSD